MKDNLEQARKAGLITRDVEQRVGDSLAAVVRRAQGSRLREGRPADLRGHARLGRAAWSCRRAARCCVDRVDPGHEGARASCWAATSRPAASSASRCSSRCSSQRTLNMLRRYVTAVVGRPEARHRRRRGGHAGARLLHQPAARAAGRRPADPARAPAGDRRQAHREAVRRQVHDGDRLLSGVGHDLHARHPGQGQARDRGAGEDPGRQAGQRAVADVAADQGRPQHRRRAGDHAAGAPRCRRTTPRSPRSGSASRRTRS